MSTNIGSYTEQYYSKLHTPNEETSKQLKHSEKKH